MRTIPIALQNILDSDQAYLTYIIELDTKNVGTKYLTTAKNTVSIGATDYQPFSGALTTNFITAASIGSSQDLELVLVRDENGVLFEDVLSLEYDNQEVRVYTVDQLNPTAGSIYVFQGKVKEHTVGNEGYITLSVVNAIGDELYIGGETYSPTCRNQFGDDKCGIDMDTVKDTFTVTGKTNNANFETDLTRADDYFKYGLVQLTSGENAGIAVEVRRYNQTNGQVITWLRFPKSVEIGDTGNIWRGCNKSIANCKRFNNINRFRGEPYKPPQNTGVGNTAGFPNYYSAGVDADGNISTIKF